MNILPFGRIVGPMATSWSAVGRLRDIVKDELTLLFIVILHVVGELEADELDAGAAEEPPEAELDEEAETLEEVGAAATSSWRL